jgi:hypothetical protein
LAHSPHTEMTYYQPNNERNAARVNARLTYFGVVTDFHPEMLESLSKNVYPLWCVNTEHEDWYKHVSSKLIREWRNTFLDQLPEVPHGMEGASNTPWFEYAAFQVLRGWLMYGVDLTELKVHHLSMYQNPPSKDFISWLVANADSISKTLAYNPASEKDSKAKARLTKSIKIYLKRFMADVEKGFDDAGWMKMAVKRAVKGRDALEHYRWLYQVDVLGMSANMVTENMELIEEKGVAAILNGLRKLIY